MGGDLPTARAVMGVWGLWQTAVEQNSCAAAVATQRLYRSDTRRISEVGVVRLINNAGFIEIQARKLAFEEIKATLFSLLVARKTIIEHPY